MDELTIDTRRCVLCGCPAVDHVPLRYVLRAWLKHRLWAAYHIVRGQ